VECTQAANRKNCPCTYPCEKRGKCCDCVVYHRKRGELPACYFSPKDEATYDRSISFYIECQTRR